MIKKTVSITSEGKKALEAELDELIKGRSAITERIATARAFGDLSENEEYTITFSDGNVPLSEPDHFPYKFMEFLIEFQSIPVKPGNIVILTVGIIITTL